MNQLSMYHTHPPSLTVLWCYKVFFVQVVELLIKHT